MITVLAQRDLGPMMGSLTRWKPRRVLCGPSGTATEQLQEHIVKFRQQGPVGACALISEIVGAGLLRAAGLPCIEPRLVFVSPTLAEQWERSGTFLYPVLAGLHFGSPYLDGYHGPVRELSSLRAPQQVVDLWVMDCWLATTDRRNPGNALLVPVEGGKFDLVAIDQSDCFGGAGRFADGSWLSLSATRRAEDAGCLDQAIFVSGGPSAVEMALEQARLASSKLREALEQVPLVWWVEAGLQRTQVEDWLLGRLSRLPALVDPASWPNPDTLGTGGLILGGS